MRGAHHTSPAFGATLLHTAGLELNHHQPEGSGKARPLARQPLSPHAGLRGQAAVVPASTTQPAGKGRPTQPRPRQFCGLPCLAGAGRGRRRALPSHASWGRQRVDTVPPPCKHMTAAPCGRTVLCAGLPGRASPGAPAISPHVHRLILAAILGGSSGRQGTARPSGGVENRTAPRRVERSLSLPGSTATRTPHAPRTHPVRTPCTSRVHPAPALCSGLQERSLRLAMRLKKFGSRGQAGGPRGMPNCTMEGGL